jgi:hypothetical protein
MAKAKIQPLSQGPQTLSDAVATHDRAAVLKSLAAKLARTIDTTESGRDVAALSKQLRDTLTELDALGQSATSPPEALARALRNRRTGS